MAQSLSNKSRLLEKYVQVVREDGLNTNKNVNIGLNGASANLWVAGNVSVGGTISGGTAFGATTITAASANALAVGANGTTNPVFNVDTSASSVVTGLNIAGGASGAGVTLSVLTSGTNESLIIKAAGSGDYLFRTNSPSTTLDLQNSTGAQVAVRLSNTGTDGTVAGDIGLFRGGTLSGELSTTGPGDLAIRSNNTGKVIIGDGVAVPAGGSTLGIQFSSTANLGVFVGSGAPTVSAAQGSIYLRTDGSSVSTRLYVNTTGSTTWTNVVTAA